MQTFSPLPQGYEPTASDVQAAVDKSFKERDFESVVFAGLGEPTLRLGVMLEAANLIRSTRQNLPLRLNTNGLGSLVHGRDIAVDLKSSGFSSVSVALNTGDPKQHQQLMSSQYGESAFPAVLQFIRRCIGEGLSVECTAVDRPDVDLPSAAALARTLGAGFRPRTFHPAATL